MLRNARVRKCTVCQTRPEAREELTIVVQVLRLHGRRQAQRGHARQVLGEHQLRVLDRAACEWRLRQCLKLVEHDRSRLVPDRVYREPERVLLGQLEELLELFRRVREQTVIIRGCIELSAHDCAIDIMESETYEPAEKDMRGDSKPSSFRASHR